MLTRSMRRLLPALGLPLLALVLLLAARPALAQDTTTDDDTGRATFIIVQTDEGLLSRAVTLTAPISGLALLESTGLSLTLAETSFGPAVCAIAGTGCPAEDCFCGGANFWNYGFWNGETWEGYAVGAAEAVVQPGGLELWRWGEFTGTVASAASASVQALPALDWLQAQQSPRDGGYGGMSAAAETMLAIGANGIAARDWQIEGGARSLETYARYNQTRFARQNVAGAGKLAVALAAADACWNGRARLPMDFYDEEAGTFSTDSGFNAWGLLGTAALSQTVPAAAVDTLKAAMLPEGGWEWQAGFGPDSNTTSLAIQALVAAGEPVTSTEVVSGLAFLRTLQQPDGGFAYDANTQGSDTNSTAYAMMAIAAAGQDPGSLEWSAGGGSGNLPIGALAALEDGTFEWQAGTGSNLAATQQAIPALLGRFYPIAVRPVERCAR